MSLESCLSVLKVKRELYDLTGGVCPVRCVCELMEKARTDHTDTLMPNRKNYKTPSTSTVLDYRVPIYLHPYLLQGRLLSALYSKAVV